MRDFLAMGGYGAYVWSAYGFAAVVLLGLLWQSWRLARRRDAELARLRRELRPAGDPARGPIVARRGDRAPPAGTPA